jgi:SAM-dependent methyltransferase
MTDGGYDSGYGACPCFWGSEPGSLVRKLAEIIPVLKGLRVLDAGCGEGKNALFLASKGATVDAYDISQLAIQHAENQKARHHAVNVSFREEDIRAVELDPGTFDIVIAYGLMHCLADEVEIRSLTTQLRNSVRPSGYLILCAFNDRFQDLSAHPGFSPALLPHTTYVNMFNDWNVIEASDTDLHETHPHNNVPHTHSMTRIIAQKGNPAAKAGSANV